MAICPLFPPLQTAIFFFSFSLQVLESPLFFQILFMFLFKSKIDPEGYKMVSFFRLYGA